VKVFDPLAAEVEPVDPANFTGGGTLVRMPGVSRSPQVNAYLVTFEPGARTAWHSHSGTQLLVVVEGRCRFQRAGERVQEVGAGGIISIDPGERHWHGAGAHSTTHIALNVEATTEWFAKVTDEEYAAGRTT
jgi:quercetin dioxygenase-like cupin family protein